LRYREKVLTYLPTYDILTSRAHIHMFAYWYLVLCRDQFRMVYVFNVVRACNSTDILLSVKYFTILHVYYLKSSAARNGSMTFPIDTPAQRKIIPWSFSSPFSSSCLSCLSFSSVAHLRCCHPWPASSHCLQWTWAPGKRLP